MASGALSARTTAARLARFALLAAVGCVAAAAASFVLVRCFTALPDYDSMVNIQLPKNLALGRGYVSTYPPNQGYGPIDADHPERGFNVEVTTGPGTLLPAAALIKIFGVQYWIPGLTTALVSLIVAALALRKLAPAGAGDAPDDGLLSPREAGASVAILLLLALTGHLFWPGSTNGFLRHWYEGMGDVPAGLVTGLGALVLFGGAPTVRRAFAGGLVLAWAHLIKTLALETNLGVIAVFALYLVVRRDPLRAVLGRLGALLAGAIAPVALAALWRRAALGRAGYREWSRAEDTLFASVGSGIAQFAAARHKLSHLAENFARHAGVLRDSYSWWQIGLTLAALVALAVHLSTRSRLDRRSPALWLGAALFAAVALHAGWWMLLEYQGWMRRLLQPLMLVALLAGVAAAALGTGRARALAVLVALALALPNIVRLAGFWGPLSSKEPELVAALHAAALLEREKAAGSVLLGCGWAVPRELEYIIQGTGNFADCLNPPTRAKGARLVLVRNRYWQYFGRPGLDYFSARCESPLLFDEPPYKIGVCQSGDLDALLTH